MAKHVQRSDLLSELIIKENPKRYSCYILYRGVPIFIFGAKYGHGEIPTDVDIQNYAEAIVESVSGGRSLLNDAMDRVDHDLGTYDVLDDSHKEEIEVK